MSREWYKGAVVYGLDVKTFRNRRRLRRFHPRSAPFGLRVIADIVPKHASDQQPWFQSARRDRNSPYREWRWGWEDVFNRRAPRTGPTPPAAGAVFASLSAGEKTWSGEQP